MLGPPGHARTPVLQDGARNIRPSPELGVPGSAMRKRETLKRPEVYFCYHTDLWYGEQGKRIVITMATNAPIKEVLH